MIDKEQDKLIREMQDEANRYERLLRIKDKQVKVLINHVAKTSMPVQMNAINKILQEIAENELKND